MWVFKKKHLVNFQNSSYMYKSTSDIFTVLCMSSNNYFLYWELLPCCHECKKKILWDALEHSLDNCILDYIQRKGHWNIKMDSVNWLSQRIMLKSMKSSHGSSSKEDGYINLQPSLRLHQENKKASLIKPNIFYTISNLIKIVY